MYLFTSESVSSGHPDKVADIISDSVVDYVLSKDSNARVACEVLVAGRNITLGGEISCNFEITYDTYVDIVKNALISIGYTNSKYFNRDEVIHLDDILVRVQINKQSSDISVGVDKEDNDIGAGDQGIMFGFASNEVINDNEYLPSALYYSRLLCNKLYKYALDNPSLFGIDIKTQVTIDYETKENFENCLPKSIHTVVVSIPSVRDLKIDKVREIIKEKINEILSVTELYNKDKCIIHINPTGKYTNHSPLHDSGLTGRKLIVDSFGGYSPIGGGAQSGKDYTKVDRSGLYASRYIAKNIVAVGLAKKCIVQLSYGIGLSEPISINVDTMGTGVINDTKLSEFIKNNFPLSPRWIIDRFSMNKPSKDTFYYVDTAKKGQVGGFNYPWEKLDLVELFKTLL